MDKLTKYKNMTAWLSIIYIILGLIFILWPGASVLSICYIVGAVILVLGLIKVISWFSYNYNQANSTFTFDFAYGIIATLLGLFMLLFPNTIVSALPIVLGILVLFDSIMRIQIAFDLKSASSKRFTSTLILALLTGVFGLIIMFNPFKVALTLTVFIGIVFLISGAVNLLNYVSVKKLLK